MKIIKRFVKLCIIFILLFCILMVYMGKQKYEKAVNETPIPEAAENIRGKENFTPIESISPMLVSAIVSVEDKRFYIHNGYDVLGICRAFYNNIKYRSFNEGGSGITQQLAKNMYFLNDNSLSRKIAEIFVAKDIEELFDKEEILELYLNVIYFGSGYYCVYDATMGYFEKTPAKISDGEATLLAGVPNAPSLYSPKVNYALSKKRQEKVLACMVDEKIITKEEAEEIYIE